MSQWQPIETAPKDGTWVLLGFVGSMAMFSARWFDGEWVDEMWDPAINRGEEPTHWQPLPMPPEASK